MSRRRVRVVAGVVLRDGKVLIQQRLASQDRPSLWEFPGGKVEAGETDAQALCREFVEELGVEVVVGAQLGRNLHAYPDLEVDLILYLGTIAEGANPQPRAAQALAWVEIENLAEYAFCAADLPLLPDLMRKLSSFRC